MVLCVVLIIKLLSTQSDSKYCPAVVSLLELWMLLYRSAVACSSQLLPGLCLDRAGFIERSRGRLVHVLLGFTAPVAAHCDSKESFEGR